MSYNVGDKVVVRSDLDDGGVFDPVGINQDMVDFGGKVVTIQSSFIYVGGRIVYYIEEDSNRWLWLDEMFEGLQPKSPCEFYSEYIEV